MMDLIGKHINKIASFITILIFGTVVIVGLVIESNYDFADFPFFEKKTLINYISILLSFIMLYFYMYIGKKLSYNIYFALGVYSVVSIIYLYLVQLEPFSDMKMIFDISTNGMQDIDSYLSTYTNQIPIIGYLWLVTKIFGKKIIVPKILNLIFNILILIFIYKIYNLLHNKNKKAIIWYSSILLPTILYENHIYNDVLFTLLTLIMVYFLLKHPYKKKDWCILYVVAILQYFIRPCGIIYILAAVMYMLFYLGEKKMGGLYLIIVLLSMIGITKLNTKIFQIDESKTYPIWSYIQMGINEEEFGFQDGTHAADWTLQDCMNKYKELGIKKVLKIFAKKEIWMWTEGTYQAQRYGFGGESAIYTKENIITNNLHKGNDSALRKIIEELMKSQYYVYSFFAFLGIIKLYKNREWSLFFYIICGISCFYLIWEMKSRYLYSIYPIILMISFYAWDFIFDKEMNENSLKL